MRGFVAFLLLSLAPGMETAFCGTSTIPYSFEVLPDGTTSLGCARPACFGFDPATGNWASQDSNFQQVPGQNPHPDGYLRATDPVQRAPFIPNNPQTSACFPAANCLRDQWAAGYDLNSPGFTLMCCAYPPLNGAQDLGVATLRNSEIAVGGEQQPGSFDYIRNIQVYRQENGGIDRYEVEMARMSCPEPMAIQAVVEPQLAAVQQFQQVQAVAQPSYYQGGTGYSPYYGGGSDFRCFTADSIVNMVDGTTKRMDELKVGDWVIAPHENLFETANVAVESWLHRVPAQETEFIVIATQSGKTIKLTENHYLYKRPCNVRGFYLPSKVQASEIVIGDCLLEMTGPTNFINETRVVNITTSIETGIYAPLTDHGKIMVNGLMASCYSDLANDVLVQTVLPNLVDCSTPKGVQESLQCILKDSGSISLLIDMVKMAVPKTIRL